MASAPAVASQTPEEQVLEHLREVARILSDMAPEGQQLVRFAITRFDETLDVLAATEPADGNRSPLGWDKSKISVFEG